MSRPKVDTSDVDALTDAVLTASRLLVAVSARSLAAVEETITLPQFRMLVLLDSRGAMKLTTIADLLDVNPSTATRMVDRLVTTEMVARQQNPATRREVVIELTPEGRRVVRGVTRRRGPRSAGSSPRCPSTSAATSSAHSPPSARQAASRR